MFKISLLFILPMVILGCSNSGGISTPDLKVNTEGVEAQGNHWSWGMWEFRFSEDHTQVEAVPIRAGQYHYCVTKLMEEYPCKTCLSLGKVKVQPDGTVKLNVTLKHPFPNSPQYTGFDVRGMVYFQSTEYHKVGNMVYSSRIYWDLTLGSPTGLVKPWKGDHMPLAFSRSKDGGGELLNADGYSCYVIPGVIYSKDYPIFSYSSPKFGNDSELGITTINPYKLFASDSERRMFLVTDKITREYHFVLPPGPFSFGYAVDASWWPPTSTPVTNPAVDFPLWANAEDPWLIEFEQLLPIKEENVGKYIFKTVVHHRGTDKVWWTQIWPWGLTLGDWYDPIPLFGYADEKVIIDDYTTMYYGMLSPTWWSHYGQNGLAVPGHHFGVLIVQAPENWVNAELRFIYGPKFVDIYVEG